MQEKLGTNSNRDMNPTLEQKCLHSTTKMSLELTDIKEVLETFITDQDELRVRIKEDPFNKEISTNIFMIHVLKSLPGGCGKFKKKPLTLRI